MSVVAAVERDLVAVRKLDSALAESALAATALALAERIDDPGNSATSVSMCSKALLDVMGRLRELLPDVSDGKDLLDELADRRQTRIARSAAT